MDSVTGTPASERIRKGEPAMWIKSDDNTIYGRLILTDTRLLFIKNDSKSIFRFFTKAAKLNPTFAIDLDTINSVAHEKYMVDNNILAIRYLQNEHARFSVIDCIEWEKAINLRQMTPHIHAQENAAPEIAQ